MNEPACPRRETPNSSIDVVTDTELKLASGGYIGETEKNTKRVHYD